MKVPCSVVQDLIPLIKDNVASEDSVKLVCNHLNTCNNCKLEFENDISPRPMEIDDKRIVSSITKILFFSSSALLFIGAFIGMALNKNSSSNLMPALTAVLGITFIGVLIYKFNLKGDRGFRRFFIGKAIGTMVIFVLLAIYLLIKYLLGI